MRLDLFLKRTYLLKSRTLAKEICDAGGATVNGKIAKSSQILHAEDVVRLRLATRDLEFRVVAIPGGNVTKRDAAKFFAILRDEGGAPAW